MLLLILTLMLPQILLLILSLMLPVMLPLMLPRAHAAVGDCSSDGVHAVDLFQTSIQLEHDLALKTAAHMLHCYLYDRMV